MYIVLSSGESSPSIGGHAYGKYRQTETEDEGFGTTCLVLLFASLSKGRLREVLEHYSLGDGNIRNTQCI
jgi:hypothetical protein